jgi:hypothetical protein
MANSKDSGVVNIHGKQYQTVALRVKNFREAHADFTLFTEIIHRDGEMVVMKASIMDDKGRVIATGHSEERRAASTINKTSALENAETSAIGRALAAFGLGGTEFATADEVANAITQQRGASGPIPANHGAGNDLDAEQKKMVELTRDKVVEALAAERDWDAYALCESITDEMLGERLYLWSLLDSGQRSRLKKQGKASKQSEPKEKAA